MRPIATTVARIPSSVCLSACLAYRCTVQKRLNRSWCRLGKLQTVRRLMWAQRTLHGNMHLWGNVWRRRRGPLPNYLAAGWFSVIGSKLLYSAAAKCPRK